MQPSPPPPQPGPASTHAGYPAGAPQPRSSTPLGAHAAKRFFALGPLPQKTPGTLGNWIIGGLVLFSSSGPVVFSRLGWAGSSPRNDFAAGLLVILAFLCLGYWTWLFAKRQRYPLVAALFPAAISVLLPIGPLPAVVSTGSLIARWKGRGVWFTCALTIVTSSISVFIDATGDPIGASFTKYMLAKQPVNPDGHMDAPLATAALLHAIVLSITIGIGVFRRLSAEKHEISAVADHALARSNALDEQMARKEERERIAREVHDALGHRLSVISLHAGALSTITQDDSPAAQSARMVQEAAAAAVDDLHSLLRMLQEPADESWPELPLSRLQEVVDDATAAGQPMSASIFVADADSAPAALSRAVYRIVQEILTNSRKHAPGMMVTLRVSGAPGTGLHIDASNPLVSPTQHADSAHALPSSHGRGLAGIGQRVELLGGSLTSGVESDGRSFGVHVYLPWAAS